MKPKESERDENYVELASIGVRPDVAYRVVLKLIDTLKNNVDFKKYKYITLETDAVDNEIANRFYREKRIFRCSGVCNARRQTYGLYPCRSD